jgi:hypothetical protein
MHVAHYLGLLHRAQEALAAAYREIADHHGDEPDVEHLCEQLARRCDGHADALAPFAARYGEEAPEEPGTRSGPLGLLRDLQDLYLMAAECDIAWTVVGQAARGLRDDELAALVSAAEQDTAIQLKWLRTRMKQAAPQALVVA